MKSPDRKTLVYQELLKKYHQDWVFAVEHMLGHMTWSKQRDIIWSVQNNPRTAVMACHSSSKTFSAAEIAVIFYNLFPKSRVITTAPVYAQVEKLLWKEINAIYQSPNIKLMGRCLIVDIKDDNDPKHFAYGFSTDKPAQAEGPHEWDILYIFDEAKGIPTWMWEGARGVLTSGNWRWLVISTTDGVEVGSEFYKCFQPGSNWNTIHISAYDLPPVTGEKYQRLHFPEPGNIAKFVRQEIDPLEAKIQLANQAWIDERADPTTGWGKDSVLFKTKVLGEICDIGSDAIIRYSQTQKMFQNYEDPNFDSSGKKRGGIDCAWGGANNTVAWKMKGLKVLALPLIITSKDLPEKAFVDYQCNLLEEYFDYDKDYELKIDYASGGLGIVCEMEKRGWNVVRVNNAEASDMPDEYENIASQMWFEGKKIIQDIACPRVPRLEMELLQRKQVPLTKKGKQQIESKKDYIKRGFDSPDFADSFLLAIMEKKVMSAYVGESREELYGYSEDF